jgi:hypothetical protein
MRRKEGFRNWFKDFSKTLNLFACMGCQCLQEVIVFTGFESDGMGCEFILPKASFKTRINLKNGTVCHENDFCRCSWNWNWKI